MSGHTHVVFRYLYRYSDIITLPKTLDYSEIDPKGAGSLPASSGSGQTPFQQY